MPKSYDRGKKGVFCQVKVGNLSPGFSSGKKSLENSSKKTWKARITRYEDEKAFVAREEGPEPGSQKSAK
jgi:hypothetical protein